MDAQDASLQSGEGLITLVEPAAICTPSRAPVFSWVLAGQDSSHLIPHLVHISSNMPLNDWQHGCAVTSIGDGQASLQNLRIRHGEVI
jgi:hypothetical protein